MTRTDRPVVGPEPAHERPRPRALVADVTVGDVVTGLVDQTLAAYGRVDVLVNNAGEGLHVLVADLHAHDLRAVFELNVVAPLSLN